MNVSFRNVSSFDYNDAGHTVRVHSIHVERVEWHCGKGFSPSSFLKQARGRQRMQTVQELATYADNNVNDSYAVDSSTAIAL